MFQVVETIVTITHVTKFTIGKAITIPGKTKTEKTSTHSNHLTQECSININTLINSGCW
jgi:hypothetical protein